jgi:hypothetical protein
MPNLDGTGPLGQGPKTGRQDGNCDKVKRGRGWRFWRSPCCRRCPLVDKVLNEEVELNKNKEDR